MPIQNIDNYLMPTRSQEASIIKSTGDSKIPAEQQFLTHEVRNKSERNMSRTNETKKTDTKDNGFDAKHKGNNEYLYTRKGKKKAKEKQPSAEVPGSEGRTIDIKL